MELLYHTYFNLSTVFVKNFQKYEFYIYRTIFAQPKRRHEQIVRDAVYTLLLILLI